MGKIKIYKQYSSQWSRKNYNNSSNIGAAACGPFSVDNVLNVPKGNDIPPMDVVKFMQKHGYAVYNHGTAWSGIPAALKYFGAKDVKDVNVSRSMTNVWARLKEGQEAVFLFGAGSRGGVCWTTQGHYMGVADYKFKNDEHYLYMMDSGGRDHDGWYSYEKHMRGLIPKVWCCEVPEIKRKKDKDPIKKPTKLPKLPKKGYFTKGDTGVEVELVQKILNYLNINCGDVDGLYGGLTFNAVKAFQRKNKMILQDGKWGNECNAKAKEVLKLK